MKNKPDIIIEKMKKEDSARVAEIQKACFSTPWSLSAIEEMFDVPGYYSLIAKKDGEIIGYIGMKAVCDEADITNVAVLPQFRQQGIGRLLLAQLQKEAQTEGIRTIFLEVRVSNTPAICLYEQAGFRECGKRKNYYKEPTEDALLMADVISDHL